MAKKYNHTEIETKWQKVWEKEKLYNAKLNSQRKHFYNLWMFPYPSAEGLHAGHAFASTGGDVYGRFMRMNGYEVFQPMGYDSFGIHSENYAIKVNETPQKMLERTTVHYGAQLRSLGHGYDWNRSLTTSDPEYYKWTQWLFVELFKAGLAYRKKANVNWCPSCKTVLADEQVIDGKCERCGTPVEKKSLAQWFVRITDYADRLLNNLSKIDWTEKVKVAQKNWIGKGEGLSIGFRVKGLGDSINVWTRYWETIFGATFLVVSPEYVLSNLVENASTDAIRYAERVLSENKNERRTDRSKTGVDTGIKVTNPATGDEIPVWVADYVLEGVGTGAVMGVPAHDTRDYEFAKQYSLPIVQVVSYADERGLPSEESGALINSGEFDGLSSNGEGKEKIKSWLIEKERAQVSVNYHLRDWLISRQRYWGAPIPMIHCSECAKAGRGWLIENEGSLHLDQSDWEKEGWYPVETESLPVILPEIADYKPKGTGRGPLADHPEFYEVKCPSCGSKAARETDVMDTFMDSSWYFLRYPSVGSESSENNAFDSEITKSWLPVNLYLGGAEHSVLHLMYARFVTQVLSDLKLINFEEPFPKLFAHGLMIKDGAKMSKSRGNVVNPDIYIEKFGADVLRMYLMFMGPMDGSPDFRDTGIEGMERYLKRVVSMFENYSETSSTEVLSKLHKTIKKITADIENLRYNTAIASIMELTNLFKEKPDDVGKDALKIFVQLLAPFAPHLAEQMWREEFGEKTSVHTSVWPIANESLIVEENVVIPVQINGKVRGQVSLSTEDSQIEETVKEYALKDEVIGKWLEGKDIKKVIFVQGRLFNFVI